MANSNPVCPTDHTANGSGLAEAMADLFCRWRTVHPRAPKSQFVKLAEQAIGPQQQTLLGAPLPRSVPAALGSDTDVWFADFWRTYPRRVGKGQARKAWASAVRRTGDPAVVLLGARRFAADPNLPDEQFIPHPTTWLNGERWLDGPLPVRQVPQAARTTRALVGLARHTAAKQLPTLPAAGA